MAARGADSARHLQALTWVERLQVQAFPKTLVTARWLGLASPEASPSVEEDARGYGRSFAGPRDEAFSGLPPGSP